MYSMGTQGRPPALSTEGLLVVWAQSIPLAICAESHLKAMGAEAGATAEPAGSPLAMLT